MQKHNQAPGRLRCAIFDFDGTLFDSMYAWHLAPADYLRSQGREPRSTLDEEMRTLSLYQAACFFQQDYNLDLPVEAIMDGINRAVERYYFQSVLPKPGIPALLRALQEAGVKLYIATATDRYLIEAALARCGLDRVFSGLFTCGEVGEGKDHPLIYRRAMEHCGADRAGTVIFEDAIHAVETAKADGFTVVGVSDPSEPRQARLEALVDCYLLDYLHLEPFRTFAATQWLPPVPAPCRQPSLEKMH